MPGMDIFRRSMPQSYNWVCMKGPKEEKAVEHTEVIEHRRKSFDKEGRRENLIFMGRSIQNLLVMNKAEENVCASERFNESYTSFDFMFMKNYAYKVLIFPCFNFSPR